MYVFGLVALLYLYHDASSEEDTTLYSTIYAYFGEFLKMSVQSSFALNPFSASSLCVSCVCVGVCDLTLLVP